MKFLYLQSDWAKVKRFDPKVHAFDGQQHFEEGFSIQDAPIGHLDLRNAVGMVRFAGHMVATHGISVIYHIGFHRGTAGAHHDGRAVDVGGFAISVPKHKPSPGITHVRARIGDDFHIALHWGLVHMWDSKAVAKHPNDSSQWVRLPMRDDDTDFPSFPVTERRLHYRLDPIPYPNPPPDTPLATGPIGQWLILRDHFALARDMFRSAYAFFVAEYTDSNAHLGPPLPANAPTPLDDPRGHFILHPDYGRINYGGKQNGRRAHFNHIHAQLGPTR